MVGVTGGTGMVGAHLLFELVSNGENVRALKRKTSNLSVVKRIFSYYSHESDILFKKIEWVEGDILDLVSLEDAFEGIDKVYHAAAFVSFVPAEKQKVFDNNINGTANVVNACLTKGVKKLCHISSIAALGSSADGGSIDETMIWSPSKRHSSYSISKFHSEMEVWRGIEEGLDAVIVNPSVIIGPGDWNKSSSALFSAINKGLKFYPLGNTGYVDVRDVAKCSVILMNSDITNERFILNADERTYKEVFQLIAKSVNKPAPSIAAKRWLAEIGWRVEWLRCFVFRKTPQITKETVSAGYNNSAYSNKKIIEKLGFSFIPIEQSIDDTGKLTPIIEL